MLKRSNFKSSRNRPEGFSEHLQKEAGTTPAKVCTRCKQCGRILFNSELAQNHRTCPECGYHFHLSGRSRLRAVCDEGSFTEWDANLASRDPLNFPGYGAKLRAGRLSTQEKAGVITGRGAIGGRACALFAMNHKFMMGSMGSAVGEKITRLFERAAGEGLPVVGFTVSGGARMQEGLYSLMQMAKTSGAVKLHSDKGLLYITVLTDPTTGGVTASFAMEGDILLAEPGALIAFAGPRVVEQTIRQKLPEGFQRAEFLLEKGFVDAVVPRPQLRHTLKQLLALHGCPLLEAAPPAPENNESTGEAAHGSL